MIRHVRSFTVSTLINIVTAVCMTGLLASQLSSCAPSPHPVSPKPPRSIDTARPVKSSSAKTTGTKSARDYQARQQQLCTQARINSLRQDLLQAQANKTAYSKHVEPEQIQPESKQQHDHTTPHHTSDTTQYSVGQGENLYSIAARKKIYNDGLLWPLIYRANRDQIKDPQQIFPGQKLTITLKHSKEEKEAARETARKSGIFLH